MPKSKCLRLLNDIQYMVLFCQSHLFHSMEVVEIGSSLQGREAHLDSGQSERLSFSRIISHARSLCTTFVSLRAAQHLAALKTKAWRAKVEELSTRGISATTLLSFYKQPLEKNLW